jgi:hypothetical protein
LKRPHNGEEEDASKKFIESLTAATAGLIGSKTSKFTVEEILKSSPGAVEQDLPAPPPAKGFETMEAFMNGLSAATTGLDFAKSEEKLPPPPLEPVQEAVMSSDDGQGGFDELDSFMKSLNAATAGLPSRAQKVEQLKKQKEAMEAEEQAAIASITKKVEEPKGN